VFVILPFFIGIYFTFTDWTGVNTGRQVIIGFKNYVDIFKDYNFMYSLYRTALYSILNIFAINIVAFLLALLVTAKLKLRNFYRAGFFMPNLIGGLVLGYIWQFIFNRAFQSSILINADLTLLGLIIVVTWQYAGYIMMIYIAAIQNVPTDLIEASKIDGANAIQRLRTIILPLVAQAFTVAMFLTLVTSFKQFDTVVSLTNGSGGTSAPIPGWIVNMYHLSYTPFNSSLDLVAKHIYDQAFVGNDMGSAQAKATVFFIVLLIISVIQVNYNKKKEVEL
jgi:raffinose/stachyose/melibiose transport system permease protein